MGLLVKILQGAPEIKLMVTSRERLDLRDEWLLPLGGLALPPGDHPGSGLSVSFAHMTEPAVSDELNEADLLAEPLPRRPILRRMPPHSFSCTLRVASGPTCNLTLRLPG